MEELTGRAGRQACVSAGADLTRKKVPEPVHLHHRENGRRLLAGRPSPGWRSAVRGLERTSLIGERLAIVGAALASSSGSDAVNCARWVSAGGRPGASRRESLSCGRPVGSTARVRIEAGHDIDAPSCLMAVVVRILPPTSARALPRTPLEGSICAYQASRSLACRRCRPPPSGSMRHADRSLALARCSSVSTCTPRTSGTSGPTPFSQSGREWFAPAVTRRSAQRARGAVRRR